MIKKSDKIGLYANNGDTKLNRLTTNVDFIEDIRTGKWQDKVLKVRIAKTQEAKDTAKNKLPNVTVSGVFTNRSDETIQSHTGIIAIDIDEKHGLKDPVAERERLRNDPYVYACFISCSGTGLCVMVRVNPKAHREAYMWMSAYFTRTYGLHTDPSCKNLARIRYVSYDPDAFINDRSIACPAEPAPKKEKTFKQYYFRSEDFDNIIKQIQDNNINLTDTYQDWIYCALSLLDKFEEDPARNYFHLISEQHPEYDFEKADAKFDNLNHANREIIPINWFYQHAEKNGIQVYGKDTEAALDFEVFREEGERDPNITPELIKAHLDEMPMVTKVKKFLKARHKNYVFNEVTEELTADGIELTDRHLNSFYVKLRENIDNNIQFDIVKRVLFSDFVKQYHPFKDFLQPLIDEPPVPATGYIDAIISAINTDTPHAGVFVKKWLVAMVASAFGTSSELVLVLCGRQKTGKTQWFKRILPEKLKEYRASLNWSGDKDEIIRMSRNLIMLDDEMGGKSQREEKQIKKITSIDKEQTRGAYKAIDTKYKRIAMFCGTTNEDWFLSDSTGNRRFLPVRVLSLNHEAFNAVNKDYLFYELYQEWQNGYDLSISDEEQEWLDKISEEFTKPNTAEELVNRYIGLPVEGKEPEYLTATDIQGYLKRLHPWSPISLTELGRCLIKRGLKKKQKRVPGTKNRDWVYALVKTENDFSHEEEEEGMEDLI